MGKQYSTVIIALALLSGCGERTEEMDKSAQVCEAAVKIGDLNTAEEFCEKAIGDVSANILTLAIKSDRLYQLARVKRQLGKFNEAETLLVQSLATTQAQQSEINPVTSAVWIEMAVVYAGQNKWREGAAYLQMVTSSRDMLAAQEQKSVVNILKRYSQKLKQTDSALSIEFEQAANSITKNVSAKSVESGVD